MHRQIFAVVGYVLILCACAPDTPVPQPGPVPTNSFNHPINSFEACLIAGEPIMESYPRQCAHGDETFVEQVEHGKMGDTRLILFQIGPDVSTCQGLVEQQCMKVNGGLFYDSIEGFTHRSGETVIIEVLRTQICDPNLENSCPQDASVYDYKFVRKIPS